MGAMYRLRYANVLLNRYSTNVLTKYSVLISCLILNRGLNEISKLFTVSIVPEDMGKLCRHSELRYDRLYVELRPPDD